MSTNLTSSTSEITETDPQSSSSEISSLSSSSSPEFHSKPINDTISRHNSSSTFLLILIPVSLILIIFFFLCIIGIILLFSQKLISTEPVILTHSENNISFMNEEDQTSLSDNYLCSGYCTSDQCEAKSKMSRRRRRTLSPIFDPKELKNKVVVYIKSKRTLLYESATQLVDKAKKYMTETCVDTFFSDCEEIESIETHLEDCEPIMSTDFLLNHQNDEEYGTQSEASSSSPEEVYGPNCGPNRARWIAYLVPDQLVYASKDGEEVDIIVDFSKSCVDHDLCYEQVSETGKNRAICDAEFFCNLKRTCVENLNGFALKKCLGFAELYRAGVKIAGWTSYIGTRVLCEYDTWYDKVEEKVEDVKQKVWGGVEKEEEESDIWEGLEN